MKVYTAVRTRVATTLLPTTVLAERKKSAALLREAAAPVDGLPPATGQVPDVRLWRDAIRQAQQGTG